MGQTFAMRWMSTGSTVISLPAGWSDVVRLASEGRHGKGERA